MRRRFRPPSSVCAQFVCAQFVCGNSRAHRASESTVAAALCRRSTNFPLPRRGAASQKISRGPASAAPGSPGGVRHAPAGHRRKEFCLACFVFLRCPSRAGIILRAIPGAALVPRWPPANFRWGPSGTGVWFARLSKLSKERAAEFRLPLCVSPVRARSLSALARCHRWLWLR